MNWTCRNCAGHGVVWVRYGITVGRIEPCPECRYTGSHWPVKYATDTRETKS